MKLLVQSDDYAFTPAVAYGIADGIDKGIIRNTGFFTNMPHVYMGVALAKPRDVVYGGTCCFGIDFNIVSGPSVCDPKEIPHLVDENGEFIRSTVRTRDPQYATEEGRRAMFPYDEVYKELRAQYDRYVELMGHKPGYLHAHSLMHENYTEAIKQISKEEGVWYSQDISSKFPFESPFKKMMEQMKKSGMSPVKVEATYETQLADVTERNLAFLEEVKDCEYAQIGGHMGYVDGELMSLTTLHLQRMKDLQMTMDPRVLKFIEDNKVELITYYDLVKAL